MSDSAIHDEMPAPEIHRATRSSPSGDRDGQQDVLEVLLAEYKQLKTEQQGRLATRDNLMYATFAAIAGIITGAALGHGHPVVLFLLPPVCLIMGWTYLDTDQQIGAIGRYVRTTLAPRITACTGAPAPVFGWELAHRSDRHRRSRKITQLGVDGLAFVVPQILALTVFWAITPLPVAVPLWIVTAAEVAGAATLAGHLWRYADLQAGQDMTKPPTATRRRRAFRRE